MKAQFLGQFGELMTVMTVFRTDVFLRLRDPPHHPVRDGTSQPRNRSYSVTKQCCLLIWSVIDVSYNGLTSQETAGEQDLVMAVVVLVVGKLNGSEIVLTSGLFRQDLSFRRWRILR